MGSSGVVGQGLGQGLVFVIGALVFLLVVRETVRWVFSRLGWLAAGAVVLVLLGILPVATAQSALGRVIVVLYRGVELAAQEVFASGRPRAPARDPTGHDEGGGDRAGDRRGTR